MRCRVPTEVGLRPLLLSVVILAFASWGGLPGAQAQGTPAADVKPLVDKALRLYQAHSYRESAEEFEKAYRVAPTLQIAFGFAQSLRMSGDCRRATKIYRVALTLGPTARQAEAIAESLARCEEVLLKEEADAKAKKEQEIREKQTAEATPNPPAGSGGGVGVTTPPPPPPDPWYLDTWGLVLTGAGVAAATTGVVFFASSRSDEVAAREIDTRGGTYGEKESLTSSAETKRVVAIGALSVGGALLISGIIRFLTRGEAPIDAAPIASGPTAGFGFKGSF